MVDRNLTGAHYGVKDWALQRLTAVIILVFSILFIIGLFYLPSTYEDWRVFFSYIVVKIVAQLLVIAVIIHAWIGIKDIWMDYIHHSGLKLFMHTITFLWLMANLVYSVYVIWGV